MVTWMDLKVHSESAVCGTSQAGSVDANSANNDKETFYNAPELPRDSYKRQDSTVLLLSFDHSLVNISTPLPLS